MSFHDTIQLSLINDVVSARMTNYWYSQDMSINRPLTQLTRILAIKQPIMYGTAYFI